MPELLERTQVSPDEMLELNDDRLYELIDGELVEKNMGAMAGKVGGFILITLTLFCQKHQLGTVLMEAAFHCFKDDPKRVRRPDVAFISASRLSMANTPTGLIKLAPDLAIEVISPNDRQYDIDYKVDEYLAAGVRQVWVVNPSIRYVRIYRNQGVTTELRADDSISGEDIIPGFSCKVQDFFELPVS